MENFRSKSISYVAIILMIIATSCQEDDSKTVPSVTTAAIMDVTATTAVGGGNITSDGNSSITASGLVYSRTNSPPTIADDTTWTPITIGNFNTPLQELEPSTTYYARAYATNGVGTSYGETITFTTSNGSPIAKNVSILGSVKVGQTLTATYDYNGVEGDPESGTTFQWYIASDVIGTDEMVIVGATGATYTLIEEDEFKYIRVGVFVRAMSGMMGQEVKSDFVGPVGEPPEKVTFIYNGKSVTYYVLISTITGRKWLDRNLGAPNSPSSYDDVLNSGDLFQWGRAADGHQLIHRGLTTALTSAENGPPVTVLSTSDSPGHNKFICIKDNNISPWDWRSPQNDVLWQGVDGINNPCPSGWRIPTKAEFEAENITEDMREAYNKLRLTSGGYRFSYDGLFGGIGSDGAYWTSSIYSSIPTLISVFEFNSVDAFFSTSRRSDGNSCRCIKN